jgi:hypothetical protein
MRQVVSRSGTRTGTVARPLSSVTTSGWNRNVSGNQARVALSEPGPPGGAMSSTIFFSASSVVFSFPLSLYRPSARSRSFRPIRPSSRAIAVPVPPVSSCSASVAAGPIATIAGVGWSTFR